MGVRFNQAMSRISTGTSRCSRSSYAKVVITLSPVLVSTSVCSTRPDAPSIQKRPADETLWLSTVRRMVGRTRSLNLTIHTSGPSDRVRVLIDEEPRQPLLAIANRPSVDGVHVTERQPVRGIGGREQQIRPQFCVLRGCLKAAAAQEIDIVHRMR